MGRKCSLAPTKRAQIVVLANTMKMSQRQIAEMKVSRHAVQLAIKKYQQTGTFEDAKRSGRPRKTSAHDDRVIKRLIQKSPSKSLPKLSQTMKAANVNVSTSSLSRRLSKEMHLKSYCPLRKSKLTPAMAKKRLELAKRHQNWTVSDWENVLWTDESTFQQFGTRVRQVRRPPGQRLNKQYVVQTMKHPPKPNDLGWDHSS